jgi:hypothetical protein
MSIEIFQPLQLTDSEKRTEQYLETFEIVFPGMLIEKVPIEDVLKEMTRELYEV